MPLVAAVSFSSFNPRTMKSLVVVIIYGGGEMYVYPAIFSHLSDATHSGHVLRMEIETECLK